MNEREKMNIVFAGHVDHGKSTVVGRLLHDTNSLPEGKLEQVRQNCERNSKPFEYAFLIDALKDEQSQGITIDSARVFFKTDLREYIIIDAPGHIEFLKNMITGAAHAEAALLVIDADEGVRENSRRHGYMLSMLGISQIVVLVSKMDLVSYDRKVFDKIVKEYTAFLKEIGVTPSAFIPVSGLMGDNIASISKDNMPWHKSGTVLSMLDNFKKEKAPNEKPFRMPVQDVYKFTKFGDSRRIIAGTVVTGEVKTDDELIFYPSGKKSKVASIESFNRESQNILSTGYAAGFTLQEQIYVTRGQIAAMAEQPPPKISTRFKASIFWLGKKPLIKGKSYHLKLGSAKVQVQLEEVHRLIDASDLKAMKNKDMVERHDVAECSFWTNRVIAFDTVNNNEFTSRFVIIDDFEISGGGIIREELEDQQKWVRDKVFLRNYKWEKSIITHEQRVEKYNQKAVLILITGEKDTGKKTLAKNLEARLFSDGRIVYFLGIGNVLYGVDADIKGANGDNPIEHIRRLAEVAHILLDAGVILLVTAVELSQDNLQVIKTTINPDQIITLWVGPNITTDIEIDMHIHRVDNFDEVAEQIKEYLREQNILFTPW